MNQPPPMPPGAAKAGPKQGGISPVGWVGIGCGAVLVLVVLGVALAIGAFVRKYSNFEETVLMNPEQTVAETIVTVSPDLEFVSRNETAGEMTVRVRSTGDEFTVPVTDIINGTFTYTGVSGTTASISMAKLADVPAWVPRHPRVTDLTAVVHTKDASGVRGVVSFTTTDSAEDARDFYKTALSGFSSTSSVSMNGMNGAVHKATLKGSGRKLKVTAMEGKGKPTTVTVEYSG